MIFLHCAFHTKYCRCLIRMSQKSSSCRQASHTAPPYGIHYRSSHFWIWTRPWWEGARSSDCPGFSLLNGTAFRLSQREYQCPVSVLCRCMSDFYFLYLLRWQISASRCTANRRRTTASRPGQRASILSGSSSRRCRRTAPAGPFMKSGDALSLWYAKTPIRSPAVNMVLLPSAAVFVASSQLPKALNDTGTSEYGMLSVLSLAHDNAMAAHEMAIM